MTWIPPWLDRQTLAKHLCCSDRTVDKWAAEGRIPAARRMGGKPMWKWSEVDQWLTIGPPEQPTEAAPAPANDKAGKIRDATRRALNERRTSH